MTVLVGYVPALSGSLVNCLIPFERIVKTTKTMSPRLRTITAATPWWQLDLGRAAKFPFSTVQTKNSDKLVSGQPIRIQWFSQSCIIDCKSWRENKAHSLAHSLILVFPVAAKGHHDISSPLVVCCNLFSLCKALCETEPSSLRSAVTVLYMSWYSPCNAKSYCDKFQGDCSLKCVPKEVKMKAVWV